VRPKIFAVDFDGTLSLNGRFPEPGTPNQVLIDALKEAAANGHKIILWTCRTGHALAIAVSWCEMQGIPLHAVNGNLSVKEVGEADSRKVVADVYIDDRAVTWEKFTNTPTMRAERVSRRKRPSTIQRGRRP
jgi:trehalose-6-phosphatase